MRVVGGGLQERRKREKEREGGREGGRERENTKGKKKKLIYKTNRRTSSVCPHLGTSLFLKRSVIVTRAKMYGGTE
jgi:hypothetical protein